MDRDCTNGHIRGTEGLSEGQLIKTALLLFRSGKGVQLNDLNEKSGGRSQEQSFAKNRITGTTIATTTIITISIDVVSLLGHILLFEPLHTQSHLTLATIL